MCAYSDAFRAMFNDGFKEKDAKEIEIRNIGFEAFKLMMEYIDTGLVVDLSIPRIVVYDLLIAADQYLLQDLKRSCENTIVQDINADKLGTLYDLSHVANAVSLRRACCLFALKKFQELNSRAWYRTLIRKMVPDIKDYFVEMLDKT
ncbi:putative chromatin remodeling & transcription regulator BTB-POZ family [Helianthus anomalus]